MSTAIIRPARPEELQQVQDLNHDLFESDNTWFAGLNVDWPYQEQGKEYFQKKISGEDGVCLVAELDSAVVGYLAGVVKPPHAAYHGVWAEVENMYVTPAVRSQGIGAQLTQAFYDWCKQQGG